MTCRTRFLGVVGAFLMTLPGGGRAGESDQAAPAFESLYGSDFKRVRLTREVADDLELAARLLAAAKEATGQPAFLAVLCEKAADLAGPHPDGVATAVEALGFLAAQIPEQAGMCAERLVDVRQKQFEGSRGADRPPAGEALIDALLGAAEHKQEDGALMDAVTFYRRAQAIGRAVSSPRSGEIDARQKVLARAMQTEREIADIQTLLEKSPGNTALREKLVRIYLVEKDDPAEASKHLEGIEDEALRKYVPAAAKGVEAAPELACQELGEWYRGLGEAAPDAAKPAMYARAKAYYERFLGLHPTEDLARTTASLALGKVDAELAKLGGAPGPTTAAKAPSPSKPTLAPSGKTVRTGQWVDLVPYVDLAKHAVKGTWEERDGVLVLTNAPGGGRAMIPAVPLGNYELEVTCRRTWGDSTVAIILPAASTGVVVALDYDHGSASGLDQVNGKGPTKNETRVKAVHMKANREYVVHAKVQVAGPAAQIDVALDGQPYIVWKGAVAALSLPKTWTLPTPGTIGLGAFYSRAEFRNVRLKMLTGRAVLPPAKR